MSGSARSVFAFALYMLGLGTVLLVRPNPLLVLFGMPATDEVWIRVVGMLVVIVGSFFLVAARNELGIFLRWTVYCRLFAATCFAGFVLLGLGPTVLILFALVDGSGAAWTALALRREGRGGAATPRP